MRLSNWQSAAVLLVSVCATPATLAGVADFVTRDRGASE